MVGELNDDAAFDLMVSENLQRQDIRPSEEGVAFKNILERGYSIAYISERFGKSETFIHSRLILNRLIPEISAFLDKEEISIGMAVEIARLEPELQENLFKEHLDSEIAFNNWKNLPLKVFRDKLEGTYTVLLSRFSFDKSECETCPFNSEIHSLFPDMSNSRCTRTSCLVNKQEKHILDSILAAIGNENVDVYISNGNNGSIQTDVVKKLGELGIEVKSGTVYRFPDNPVIPSDEDFEGDPTGYEQAQKEFLTKQTQWNSLQGLIENGLAKKVVMIENLAPVPGYIMVPQETNTTKTNPENQNSPVVSTGSESTDNPNVPETPQNPQSPQNPQKPQSPNDNQSAPTKAVKTPNATIKPDLMATLEEKDRKNREEALEKVIEDARTLIKDTDIPPVEITPFEEMLIDYILLSFLDKRHYESFGLIEGQTLTEDVALGLYTQLTEEQRNMLKRDFLIRHLTIKNGISKRAALLIELAKHHFPVEVAEIEHIHNEEYQNKWAVIREQIEKLKSENKELQEVA